MELQLTTMLLELLFMNAWYFSHYNVNFLSLANGLMWENLDKKLESRFLQNKYKLKNRKFQKDGRLKVQTLLIGFAYGFINN